MEYTILAVQEIPINKIKPNALNPRHVITADMVEAMAASLKAVGLKNPIKVRQLGMKSAELGVKDKNEKSGEEASFGTEVASAFVKTSADKSSSPLPGVALAKPGRDDSNFEYEVISGHIRLEGAKKLGWEEIPALILDLTPDEAELTAILDNRGENMHWLDWYQAIERRLAAPSKPFQQKVADELGITQSAVSRATKLLRYLNSASRDLLYQNLISASDYQVSENAVFRLADLEDPQVIEKALEEVIAKRMTEPQVAVMVAAVNNGLFPDSPEATPDKQGSLLDKARGGQERMVAEDLGIFDNPDKSEEALPQIPSASPLSKGRMAEPGEDPYASYWAGLPKGVKVTQTRKGYRMVMDLSPSEAVPAVYGALSNLEFLKGQAGEKEDLRYRHALPQIHKEAVKIRQLEVRSGKLEVKANGPKPGIATAQSTPTLREPQGPEQSRGVSAGPRNDGKNDDQGNPNLLGTLQKTLESGLKTAPTAIEDNLAKDAKQALNYQIRRGMRNLLKNLFN